MDSATTEEIEARCEHCPPQVMSVKRRWAGTGAHEMLRDNDIVLEVNGRHIETFRDIEEVVAGKPHASVLLVRGGKKIRLDVPTTQLADGITDRVIIWCGAVLQVPPAAIASQRGQTQCGVYVSSRFHGSPAAKYDLPPMTRIVEVNGQKTPDLDTFFSVV